MPTTFKPRFTGDSRAFQTMEEAVTALGERQRRHRAAMLRLGDYCRQRELLGDDERQVQGIYRRAARRLAAQTDPAGVRAGFAPGLRMAAE